MTLANQLRAVFFSCAALLIFYFSTPYMAAASISYFLLLNGALFCEDRRIQAWFMSGGVLIDLSLVLFLEISRSAIGEAIQSPLNPYQRGHILCSLLAVLLYFPAMLLGLKTIRAGKNKNQLHRRIGQAALFFRSIGFVLMFSLLAKIQSKP